MSKIVGLIAISNEYMLKIQGQDMSVCPVYTEYRVEQRLSKRASDIRPLSFRSSCQLVTIQSVSINCVYRITNKRSSHSCNWGKLQVERLEINCECLAPDM